MNAEQLSRRNRKYQAKHRTSNASYLTQVEDMQIILAWMDGNLSEGQAAKALGYDRVTLRELRDSSLARGAELARKLMEPSSKTTTKIDALYGEIVRLKTKRPPGQVAP